MIQNQIKEQSLKVKMCGMRRKEDIAYANEVKPDAIGYIFFSKSKRYVTGQQAREIDQNLDQKILSVGVFVNETIEKVTEIANEVPLDGMKSLFLQNEEGQINPVYSISAGLDYPGIGPEHAHLHEIGRAEYVSITDEQAVKAFEYLSKTEGVIPAIESSHAVAAAMEIVPTMSKDQSVVICLSGRGDKDVYQVARYRGVQLDEN